MSSSSSFSMETLVGKELLTKLGTKKSTKDIMKGKTLCGLYFSASWCPPCKVFSPHLTALYDTLQATEKNELGLIYVSSDKTIPDFEGYYGKMSFCAIPPDGGSAAIKNNLAQALGISGIPTLIIIDVGTGELVSVNGRNEVSSIDPKNVEHCQQLLQKWNEMERRPLSEASGALAGAGGGNPIMNIIMFFVKRPVFIFGLLYIYRITNKKIQAWLDPDGTSGGAGGAIQDDPIQPEESEF